MKLNLLTLWFSVNMLSVILAVSAIEQDSVTILQGFIWACVSLVSIALVIRPINRLIEKEEAEKQANRKGVGKTLKASERGMFACKFCQMKK